METLKKIIMNKKEEKKALKEMLGRKNIKEIEEAVNLHEIEEWAVEEIAAYMENERVNKESVEKLRDGRTKSGHTENIIRSIFKYYSNRYIKNGEKQDLEKVNIYIEKSNNKEQLNKEFIFDVMYKKVLRGKKQPVDDFEMQIKRIENNIEKLKAGDKDEIIENIFRYYMSKYITKCNEYDLEKIKMHIEKSNNKEQLNKEFVFGVMYQKILIDKKQSVDDFEMQIERIENNIEKLKAGDKDELIGSIVRYYISGYIMAFDNIYIGKLKKYIGLSREKEKLYRELVSAIDGVLDRLTGKIKEKVGPDGLPEHYRQYFGIYEEIEYFCGMIEQDDTDDYIIQKLSLMLRKKEFLKKDKILNLLLKYYENSRKVRAANIFLNEAEILQRKTELLSKPRMMTVSLTTNCNLECVMCDRTVRPLYEMNDEHMEYIKRNMPYLEEIRWLGGEIFLYKGFDELMELACKYNVRQAIVTNGLLLNEKRISFLVKNNINLSISIDAAGKELYEKIRVNGSFEKLIDILDIIKKYKGRSKSYHTIMAVVVMSLNYDRIDELIEFAIFYGFSKIRFQQYTPHGLISGLSLTQKQSEQAIERISVFRKKYENNEMPLEIESNFLLENNCSIDIISEKTCNLNDNKETFKEKNRLKKCNDRINNKDLEKNNNSSLYCIAPWTTLCFFENNFMKFACAADLLKVNMKSDIWNSKPAVEYRKKIINNDFTICNKLCYEESGIDGERTRLGI